MLSAECSRLHAELNALNGGLVGASTGYMAAHRGNWACLVHEAQRVSTAVVELSALSRHELPGLVTFLHEDWPSTFRRVLVHAPAKEVHGWSRRLVSELSAAPASVEGFVIHPETLAEPNLVEALGSRVFLENMDSRKSDARSVKEMARYFEVLPRAGFCFDIAHAWMNDPTLRLAHELLDAFGDRLREVHISSILESGHHVPLTKDDFQRFKPVLERCVGVPWILEADMAA